MTSVKVINYNHNIYDSYSVVMGPGTLTHRCVCRAHRAKPRVGAQIALRKSHDRYSCSVTVTRCHQIVFIGKRICHWAVIAVHKHAHPQAFHLDFHVMIHFHII